MSPRSSSLQHSIYFSWTYNCLWVLQHSTTEMNCFSHVFFSWSCIQMTLFNWSLFYFYQCTKHNQEILGMTLIIQLPELWFIFLLFKSQSLAPLPRILGNSWETLLKTTICPSTWWNFPSDNNQSNQVSNNSFLLLFITKPEPELLPPSRSLNLVLLILVILPSFSVRSFKSLSNFPLWENWGHNREMQFDIIDPGMLFLYFDQTNCWSSYSKQVGRKGFLKPQFITSVLLIQEKAPFSNSAECSDAG